MVRKIIIKMHDVYLTVVEMPFGVSPVLEVDGIKISGSANILRYLGEKYGKVICSCIIYT